MAKTKTVYYSLAVSIALIVVLLVLAGCNNDSSDTSKPVTPEVQVVSVIPAPVKLEQTEGGWSVDNTVNIVYEQNTELKDEATYLADKLKQNNNLSLNVKEAPVDDSTKTEKSIILSVEASATVSEEGYKLDIVDGQANIIGNTETGVRYGIQTLLQLLPYEKNTLPIVSIIDYPKFSWRGMHLDVARNFFSVDNIKKFIDQLSYHKLNKFHWHLTDDQGWRIEIRDWPKLTEVGGCRASTPPYGDRTGSDGQPTCGYYTQEEIKEVVAYAKSRHVEVIPEIDMPGHMAAAVAAYPELGVTDTTEPFKPEVKTTWGVHPYLLNTDVATFRWIDQIFTQIAELFPNSRYVHLGGDEATKEQWKTSKSEQDRIKELKLSDENGLQRWFVREVEKTINSKRFTAVGWDEVMEGRGVEGDDISKNMVVMAWRDKDKGRLAAERGNPVVMASGLYFDHYQAPEKQELAKGVEYEAICCLTTLQDVYNYDPIPPKLAIEYRGNILGAQGQLWSEYMHSWDKVEYQAFPRMAALSEMLWTPKERQNYEDFRGRLNSMLAYYERENIRYGEIYDGLKQ
ncbi:beta-N-acetylhexosaminidase [Aeromonas enteropelogenes]|uniref:beta-N-acetylhexosaminidase n=1 Tax=Aeromonas enteropelogenes TaxID=29489 RepID=UPI003BA05CEB